MIKIFKNFKNSKGSVILIIMLLILQAYCDLALPQYTSDIVDVGIQQSGIENAVPKQIREETYQSLQLFMPQEDIEYVNSFYEKKEDGLYYVLKLTEEENERLNQIFATPMVMQSAVTEKNSAMLQMADKEQILAVREKILEQMGNESETIISQKAVLFV